MLVNLWKNNILYVSESMENNILYFSVSMEKKTSCILVYLWKNNILFYVSVSMENQHLIC